MNSKVSIVIPVYNAEATLEKCLNSVLKQTYKNIEVLVINDGSNDKTKEIIEKYLSFDKRFYLIEQENSGVSKARNNGINNSTGEFVLFLDSDDWLEENTIEMMVKIQNDYDVDVVRCNYFDDKIKATTIPDLFNLTDKKVIYTDFDKELVREHFLLAHEPIKNLVMLLLIKKDILISKKIYFDENLYMMEDVFFYQKLFSVINSIYFMSLPLYHYIENSNSVTNSPKKFKKMIYGIINTNKILNNYLKEKSLLNFKYKLLNANHLRIIIVYVYNIYIHFGKREFKDFLEELYNVNEFDNLLKNIDDSQISSQFKLFFYAIKYKKFNLLCILFKLKKYKERWK